MDRPAVRRDRADGLEDARAPGDAGRGRSDHPGHDRSGRLARRAARARRGARVSAPDQGGRRRRREGHGGGARARRCRARVRDCAATGPVVLREPRRVCREADHRSASRRGPGARGRARQCHPSRRARLHDPAPAPEAPRGDAFAGGRYGAARPHRTNRRRRGARGRLPLGRNDRRAADAGRRVLLHGDEHPHSGRAHGHGRGDRASIWFANRSGSRSESRSPSRRSRSSCAGMRSNAASTPRMRRAASCRHLDS